ncbi:MAG TPA: hypothetical protein VKU87_07005, partial [Thermomicrobiaceae bacterium]|nr:hypothetical protein [Thermomicrobiaceae bacterium]
MAYTLEQLGQVFRNTMLNILLGGDGNLPPPKDSFITWCQPGLPYTADDLNFTTNLGSAPDAETQNKIFENAFNFATQVDFIPDPTMAYTNDKQQGIYRNEAGIRLSEIYSQILRFSKVADTPLTDDQKAKLDKFRGLLRVTKTVPDIVTDEPKEVTSDSPMVQAYKAKQQAYLQAGLAYNAKRIAALTATGPDGKAASMDWALNAQLYKMAVDSAAGDWEANGYKNDV